MGNITGTTVLPWNVDAHPSRFFLPDLSGNKNGDGHVSLSRLEDYTLSKEKRKLQESPISSGSRSSIFNMGIVGVCRFGV